MAGVMLGGYGASAKLLSWVDGWLVPCWVDGFLSGCVAGVMLGGYVASAKLLSWVDG